MAYRLPTLSRKERIQLWFFIHKQSIIDCLYWCGTAILTGATFALIFEGN